VFPLLPLPKVFIDQAPSVVEREEAAKLLAKLTERET